MSTKSISIIGIGRLGLCTALCFAMAKYNVVGVDINGDYVKQLNDKTFYSQEPHVNEYLALATNFRATTDITEAINNSDFIYILVDTPTIGNNNYDTKNLDKVLSSLNSHKIKDKHVIIGCTIMPGYIDNHAKCLLVDCKNVSVSYNPEFIRQGSIIDDYLNADMILIGEGCKEAGDFMEELYLNICGKRNSISGSKSEIQQSCIHSRSVGSNSAIRRMSPASAEICKLAVNCFITMKISYSNMIGDIADNTPNADKHDILNAVGFDTRVGSKCLIPGYSYGGPCFPRDNRALSYYANTVGIKALLSDATDNINNSHTEKQIQDLIKEDRKVYVIDDVAYKPNCPVPIIEESAKIKIACGLVKSGKRVIIQDRDFILDEVKKQYGDTFEYRQR